METQSHVLILLLFISSLVSTLAIAPSPRHTPSHRIGVGLVGSYKPIQDVNDPHIQQVAKFAVTEHNKQAKTNLTFDSVIKGESQVVAGINYRLVIAAKNGNTVNNYLAEVYDKTYEGSIELISFKPLLKVV